MIITQDTKLIHHFLTLGAPFGGADTAVKIVFITNTAFLNPFIRRDCYAFGNVRIELLSVDPMMEDTSRLKQSMSIRKMHQIFVDPCIHAVAFINLGRIWSCGITAIPVRDRGENERMRTEYL